MEINGKVIVAFAMVAALATPSTYAQDQANAGKPGIIPVPLAGSKEVQVPAPAPSRQPGKPEPRLAGPGEDQKPGRNQPHGLTSLTTLSGTVGAWTSNDDALLDGFTLNMSTGSTTVKFPPHLGQQVQKTLKPGSSVNVTGFTEKTPQGESRFRMNSLTTGKVTVLDAPPTPKTTAPETPALTTTTGKITDYRRNHDGRVSGLVLEDKTVVNIPPHVANQLTDLAKIGSTITVQGYPKMIHDGQVQLEKVTVLRASVLTIGGQQYLVR